MLAVISCSRMLAAIFWRLLDACFYFLETSGCLLLFPDRSFNGTTTPFDQ